MVVDGSVRKKSKNEQVAAQVALQPQTFTVGNKQVTREEFQAAKQRAQIDLVNSQAPAGQMPGGRFPAEQQQQQQAGQALAAQVGSQQVTPPQVQPQANQGSFSPPVANNDIGSAVAVGLQQGAVGAGIGAAAGLATTGGVLSIPGAVVGGIAGFIRGTTEKLKADANQNIAADYSTLKISSTAMTKLIVDAKTDPQGSVAAFNSQLSAIDEAYSKLQLEKQSNVNKFLGADTRVEMAKFDQFYSPGGMREILQGRMQAVLMNPNTNTADLEAQIMVDFQDSQP